MRPKSKPQAGRLVDAAVDKIPNPFTETRLQAAIRIRDAKVGQMDRTWGTDVLQSLVGIETGTKFAGVCEKRDAAQEAGDDDEFIRLLGIEIRGLDAMDAEARAAGREPLKVARSWATRAEDGQPYVFVQTADDARAAARSERWKGYSIWSLPEVIRVLEDKSFEAVLKAKALWPEAKVEEVRKPAVNWKEGDEVGL